MAVIKHRDQKGGNCLSHHIVLWHSLLSQQVRAGMDVEADGEMLLTGLSSWLA